MSVQSFFMSRGLTTVCGRTYPGTFAIVRRESFLADQVSNRDSASWKKAEHIVVEEVQSDEGRSILSGWRALTAAEPVGRSVQKLYVAVSPGRYTEYDADGNALETGTLDELIKR